MVAITEHALTFIDAGSVVRPGPSTTGPNNSVWQSLYGSPVPLTTIGSTTIDDDWIAQNGNVLQNFQVTGIITVETVSTDFTIRNFRVLGGDPIVGNQEGGDNTSNNFKGIRVTSDLRAGNVFIEHGECLHQVSDGIDAQDSSAASGRLTIIRNVNIHEQGGDGLKLGRNAVLEDSWIHHLGRNLNSHADGCQTEQPSHAPADLYNITYRRNFFDMPIPDAVSGNGPGPPYSSNACIFNKTNGGAVRDITVDGNWLNGGNHSLWFTDSGGHGFTGCSAINNLFYHDFRFSPAQIDSAVTRSNNRWAVTGPGGNSGDLIPGG